jgi:capsid protein
MQPLKTKALLNRLEAKQIEILQRDLEMFEALDEDKGWNIISEGSTFKAFEMLESDHRTMLKQAYRMWRKNPHARAAIRNLEKFTIGAGATISPHDNNPLVKEKWQEFEQINNWNQREKEIVRRTFRDGECFLRFFTEQSVLSEKAGQTVIRFISPLEIVDPTGIVSYGIETDPDDIETPLFYYWSRGGILKEKISAEEMLHIKILADSDEKRGRSILEVIMPLIAKYEQWLNDRIVLNKIRTAIALVRKRTTPAAARLSTISPPEQVSSSSSTTDTIPSQRKLLKAGSVITTPPGVELEYLNPNLDSRDVQADGRAILLAMTAGISIPEYMLTGDASNANMASTMVSESPGVREFQDWQDFFQGVFKEIFRRVIQAHINYGTLPFNTDLNCDVNYPSIIHRNFKEEVEAWSMVYDRKLISKETWRGKLGLNSETEKERIIAEQEEEPSTLSEEF